MNDELLGFFPVVIDNIIEKRQSIYEHKILQQLE